MIGGSTYNSTDTIPLFYIQMRNGAPVTGLTVSVSVVNALTGATLLASTNLPEVIVGSGLYAYAWSNTGVTVETECVATYAVAGYQYKENFTIDTGLDRLESEDSKAV